MGEAGGGGLRDWRAEPEGRQRRGGAGRELAEVEGRRGEVLEADHAEEERLGRRHRRRQRELEVGVDRIVVGGRQRVGGAEAPVEEERRAVERVREDAVAPRRHALLLFCVHARVPVEEMGRECGVTACGKPSVCGWC